MDPHDLVAYLAASADMSWSTIRNLVAMRYAHGRPMSWRAYEHLRAALETLEMGSPAVVLTKPK